MNKEFVKQLQQEQLGVAILRAAIAKDQEGMEALVQNEDAAMGIVLFALTLLRAHATVAFGKEATREELVETLEGFNQELVSKETFYGSV